MSRHLRTLPSVLAPLAMLLAVSAGLADVPPPAKPKLEKGTERAVTIEAQYRELRQLPEAERAEAVRDAILAAAFASLEPDPAYETVFAATFAPFRRPYRTGLAEMQVGTGRVAPLKDGEFLVVVPAAGDKMSAWAWPQVCRLLDRQWVRAGQPPRAVHLVTYRGDGSDGDEPEPAFYYIGSLDVKDFYTDGGKYGFVERAVKGDKDLKRFLEDTNDLLAARATAAGELILSGRKYPEHRPGNAGEKPRKDAATTFVRPWEPLGWDDLRVLRRAFTGAARVGAAGSELGFSLDEWVEGKALARAVKGILAEGQGKAAEGAIPEPYRKALEEGVKPLAERKAVPQQEAVSFRKALAGLETEVKKRRLDGKPLTQPDAKLAEREARLKRALADATFSVARYEGGTKGTRVGMCQYYTDDMAKIMAFGQLGSLFGVSPVKGIPPVPGFVPASRLEVADFYPDETLLKRAVRLWWGTDAKGIRWQGDRSKALFFAPVAIELFMMSSDGLGGREEDPGIVWGTFARSWNDRYLEIADYEPQYHLFNQIHKYAVLLKWLKENKQSHLLAMLDGGPALEDARRYDKWYPAARKEGLVGILVPVLPSPRDVGELPGEATEDWLSGPYLQAGREFGWRGGSTGPSAKEIGDAKGNPDAAYKLGAEFVRPAGWRLTLPETDNARARLRPPSWGALRSPGSWLSLPERPLESTFVHGPGGRIELRAWLPSGQGEKALPAGTLIVRPARDEVRLSWVAEAFDRGYTAVAQFAAENRLAPEQLDGARYSKDGKRLYLRMKDGWLALASGGSPPPPESPGAGFVVGQPGDRGGWIGQFLATRDVAEEDLEEATKPRYHVFTPTRIGGKSEPRWLSGPGVVKVKLGDGQGALFLDAAGRLVAEGKIADIVGKLDSYQLFALAGELGADAPPTAAARGDVRLPVAGARTQEMALDLGGQRMLLVRGGDGWTLRENPTENDVLAPGSVIRRVKTYAGPEARFQFGDLLLPERWTPEKRREVGREVVSLIGNDFVLVNRLYATGPIDLAALRKVGALRTPTRLKLVLEGKDVLRLADGTDTIRLEDLGNENVPEAWRRRLGKPALVDVSGLAENGSKAQMLALAETLGRLGEKYGQKFIIDARAEGTAGRLVQLYDGGPLTVSPLTRGLEKKSHFWLNKSVKGWLNLQPEPNPLDFRAQLEVRVEHFADETNRAELLRDVADGRFDGKHVVLIVCNDAPIFFLDVARRALDRGAKSFTIQAAKVDIAGAVLTAESLKNNADFRGLRAGTIPAETWALAEKKVLDVLREKCDPLRHSKQPIWADVRKEFPNLSKDAVSDAAAAAVREKFPALEGVPISDAEVEKALRDTFPKFREAPRLFYDGGATDGKFNRSLFKRTIDGMEGQNKLWLQVVFGTKKEGAGSAWSDEAAEEVAAAPGDGGPRRATSPLPHDLRHSAG